jgi:hypothetical protein
MFKTPSAGVFFHSASLETPNSRRISYIKYTLRWFFVNEKIKLKLLRNYFPLNILAVFSNFDPKNAW